MFNARLVLRVRLGMQLVQVTTTHTHPSQYAKPYRIFNEGAKRFKSKKQKDNGNLNDTNVDKTSEPKIIEEPILKDPPITDVATSKNPPISTTTKKKTSGSYSKYILMIALLGGVCYGGAVYHSIHDEKFREKFTKDVPGANQVVEYVDGLYKQGTFHHLKQQASELSAKTIDFELDKKISPLLTQEIHTFTSEEPIINELYQTINQLASIVKETDASSDIILKAKEEVKRLNDRINSSRTEIYSLIDAALKEQEETFNTLLETKKRSLSEKLDNSEKEKQNLKDEFEKSKQLLLKQHKDLTDELSRQAQKHAEELRNTLIREGVRMKRQWIREIKSRVEQERDGRLANLEELNLRLKQLQNLSVQNVDDLDDRIKDLRLWRALYALKNAVNQPHRIPFANEVATLKKEASTDELVTVVLSTIDDSVSSTGIESVSNLVARFAKVREAVRSASLVPENGGLLPHALSRVLYRFMFRKHGMMEGDDVEAVLARVEHHLKEHDLDKATRELNQLKGWPKTITSDWMRAARDHLEVKQAIQVCFLGAVF
ncbi:6628_t:CDS:2 [Ambispora leptoticha]|uniref:MICOS complex subunit MIC60 n=1 Tax=Ambispora leptoticha TaxID=144679 RepID=A0A9N9AMM6_9GLOM|nr:6628_t:CDS:2 [Ambispora leptoticha]